MLQHDTPLAGLSPRELQVLGMAAEGFTNTRIAERLGVSVHGVKFHLASIYRKLHVSNRTEAAAMYVRATTNPPHAEAS